MFAAGTLAVATVRNQVVVVQSEYTFYTFEPYLKSLVSLPGT